ncbi:MAG TPA: PIG-L family deacetylase [Ktedonobacteraceae bacterium]|nr:PIG-L family deacetylase [Ktedonobacteraceae bacterium]
MAVLLIVLLVLLLLWITGFLLVTDFAVPLKDARQFHRVLVIFPHADDEAISCGGFLHRVSERGSTVTLALLTKGERGTSHVTHNGSLKDIRTREAQAVTALLRVSKLIQKDFGDGALHEKKQELTTFIAMTIEQEQPDLLITYDLAGFYGHVDHITCSEIITELKKARFPEIPLWYVTFPERVLARVKLPEHMAADPLFQEKRAFPTHKVFIDGSVFPKITAWYTYKSQRLSLAQGISKFVPIWLLWFFLSMMLFEYFAEAS